METQALSTLAKLLKQPQEAAADSVSNADKDSNDELVKGSTIFGLRSEDRYRVLKLIEELVDAQETADKLREKLEEQKFEFKEKRSALIKKLDLLSEKHEKSLSNIQHLKKKHSNSLQILEKKISTVSQKFEESLVEIKELRKINAELKEENMTLRQLNSKYVGRLSNMEDENSRLSFMVDDNKNIEKVVQRQLKNLTSGISMNLENKRDKFVGSSISLHSNLTKDSLCDHSLTGAGDCVHHLGQSSSYGFDTIKAPINSDKIPCSSLKISTNSVPMSHPIAQTIPDSACSNSELADMTILENLFFRF